jgi:hypothetical protein
MFTKNGVQAILCRHRLASSPGWIAPNHVVVRFAFLACVVQKGMPLTPSVLVHRPSVLASDAKVAYTNFYVPLKSLLASSGQ